MLDLQVNLNEAIGDKALLQKELEVLKTEKDKQLKGVTARINFVEGLLSHMLAKPIRVIHPDGAVEHRWQPVHVISGETRYYPGKGL